MASIRLVTSPGEDYAREMLGALADATSFVLITGFASVAGVEVLATAIRQLLDRGGQGRVVLAVDRRGFNTAAVFERLMWLKSSYGARMSIGAVLEDSGLLHAKALFTEGPRGDQLLVGSANLTQGALGTNHELGLLLQDTPRDVRRAFLQFVTSIAPRSLDGPDARGFLEARGLLATSRPSVATSSTNYSHALANALEKLRPLEPLSVSPEEHLAGWIHRGYIVGRGRRSLDALVLRLPQEHLMRTGHIRPPRREVLGLSSHETRTLGYGIDLIPTQEAESLRRDAKRVSLLLAKLTLNLPCFGLWMPDTYWDGFVAARTALQQVHSLTPARVREHAAHHRNYLLNGGLQTEVDRILTRLEQVDVLLPGKLGSLKEFLMRRLHAELILRTPDVLASCIEFRTARQRWTPFDQTDAPFRQLMVDIVQATFATTYRTGDWPRRFRSCAAREIATAIESRLATASRVGDGSTATGILDQALTWEDAARPMAEVVADFRALIDDDLKFPDPELDVLTNTMSDVSDEDMEGGSDDDLR